MESKDYCLIKEEVDSVLSALNTRQVLTFEDELEIEDHFFCNVEDLESKGLNVQEALLIAKSRFGALEGIKEDYEIARPEKNWLQISFIGILGFSILKMGINLINIISESFWIGGGCSGLQDGFLYMDLPIRFGMLAIFMHYLIKYVSKQNLYEINKFWFIPLLYLSTEIYCRWVSFILIPGTIPGVDPLMYGRMWERRALFSAVVLLVILLVVSMKLYKLKNDDLQYV